jgi:hypothetical protein
MEINPETGTFSIKLDIDEGKTVEDVIERIQYSHPNGSMVILPETEFDLKRSGKQSKLTSVTHTSRSYVAHLQPMPDTH